jgi:hypothetical protein
VEKTPYITTESGGFRAFVDGYVLTEYGASVCYLSVYGAVGAVQSLCASLVSGRDVQLWAKGEFGTELHKKWGKVKYRMVSKRLPSKMLSMIVLIDEAVLSHDQNFVIITREHDPVDLLYRNLVHRSELPLHSDWAEWLWVTFKHFEWVTELPSCRMCGYKISFDDDELAEKIEQGIRSKTIPKIK